jgi:hypothetical protein
MLCYFHLVSCHEVIPDETGIEILDLDAARIGALKAVRELREEVRQLDGDWREWRIDVTDVSGTVLMSIRLDAQPL